MQTTKVVSSPKRLARLAGVFYLLVGIFGGFAEGYADPKLYVAGNSAATAGNVLANLGLVRMSVAAHLLDAVFFVLTAMALYVLLQHVHKSVARAMLVFVIVAVGIISLNAVFQFEALQVATGASYATAFGAAGANALVLLLLDIQHYGTLAAQVFFGLWLAPLGYLAYKSGLFPKALGVVLDCRHCELPGGPVCRRSWLQTLPGRSMGSWASCPPLPRSGWSSICSLSA